MGVHTGLKKLVSVALWCAAGTGVLALLIAAIHTGNGKSCKGLAIEINGGGKALALERWQIMRELSIGRSDEVKDRKIGSFDLQKMEQTLEQDPWVRDAQLFFDNAGMLRVKVAEREPIARVYAANGGFYLDSAGRHMPLTQKARLRLPVFTGYPADRDSAFDVQVRQLALYLDTDPFWSKAIEQVNITPAKTFEMVPVIGNHRIDFGDATAIEEKFHRLMLFYRQVLVHTGFDRYQTVRVAFAGQVVGEKRPNYMSRADSLAAIRNIQEMIRQSARMQTDTTRLRDARPLERTTETEETLQGYDLPAVDSGRNYRN